MPLNIYDQLNMKLSGGLQLKPCNGVKVVGYNKQSVSIVGRIAMRCTHANVIKKCLFYITDITDTKVILGLNFCRAFNLVKVICDDNSACKQVTINAINDFPKGQDVPNTSITPKILPPVDVNLKLWPDCKAHILELYPDLFDGVGMMKHAMVKLDVNQSAIPVVLFHFVLGPCCFIIGQIDAIIIISYYCNQKHNNDRVFQIIKSLHIGRSRGQCHWHMPPPRVKILSFWQIFQNLAASGVGTPLWGWCPPMRLMPPTGNPGSATATLKRMHLRNILAWAAR